MSSNYFPRKALETASGNGESVSNFSMPRFHDSLTPIRRAPGTTPEVGYAYADGSSGNTARRTGMTYPNGRVLESGYGATDSADDLLSRVASLKKGFWDTNNAMSLIGTIWSELM